MCTCMTRAHRDNESRKARLMESPKSMLGKIYSPKDWRPAKKFMSLLKEALPESEMFFVGVPTVTNYMEVRQGGWILATYKNTVIAIEVKQYSMGRKYVLHTFYQGSGMSHTFKVYASNMERLAQQLSLITDDYLYKGIPTTLAKFTLEQSKRIFLPENLKTDNFLINPPTTKKQTKLKSSKSKGKKSKRT